MGRAPINRRKIEDLLYQTLETELGGVNVYRMALVCAKRDDLRAEWNKYLAQTMRHEAIVRDLFEVFGLDPDAVTPGRLIVREKGKMLLSAMQRALKDSPESAQIVAAECVVDAETKDHKNWQLLGKVVNVLDGKEKEAVLTAHQQVEEQEDEHLYHTIGWSRELSLEALGLPAMLPPPEERFNVKTAVAAAQAKQKRDQVLPKA